MDAAIYLRQSEDREGDEEAVDRQREDCIKLAAKKGWSCTEYVDNDTSATSKKPRPAYQRMLTDIGDGHIQAVVAWDLDRLYRQPRELEDLIDLADARGLQLATVGGEADLSTDNGRLFARIKGAVGKSEVERKSARQKRANKQRAEAGTPTRSTVPFGYRHDDNGNMVLQPEEATLIRDAYSVILAGGSLHTIAKAWNAAHVTTRRGKQWSGATVRQLLMSHRNAGLAVYQGEPVADGDWPPIIDRDLLDGVRAILTEKGRRIGGTSSGRKHLLSGIAVCGRCSKTVGSATGPQQRRVYVCKHCFGVTRDMTHLDGFIRDIIIGRLSRPDAADLLITEKRDDLNVLRDRAAALRARQDEAAGLFADGAITASQLKITTAKLASALANCEAQMFDAGKARVFDGIIGTADPATVYDGLPLDRKRAIIDVLISIAILPTVRGGRGFDHTSIRVEWR